MQKHQTPCNPRAKTSCFCSRPLQLATSKPSNLDRSILGLPSSPKADIRASGLRQLRHLSCALSQTEELLQLHALLRIRAALHGIAGRHRQHLAPLAPLAPLAAAPRSRRARGENSRAHASAEGVARGPSTEDMKVVTLAKSTRHSTSGVALRVFLWPVRLSEYASYMMLKLFA